MKAEEEMWLYILFWKIASAHALIKRDSCRFALLSELMPKGLRILCEENQINPFAFLCELCSLWVSLLDHGLT